MLPQAQGMMIGQISLDTPFGALLALLLLVVLASGVIGETRILDMMRFRLNGQRRMSHRVATAAQRS